MIINSAIFVKSSTELRACPEPDKPEYAFVGRSNVGKSSLINMLTGRRKLARISSTPGKTQTINHYIINENWYLADLPGYGYARVSKKDREQWGKLITSYALNRANLVSLFVLVDSRHEPMKLDYDFMDFMGRNNVPVVRVFTKSDKLSENKLEKVLAEHDKYMLKTWESLPPSFISSATRRTGRDNILDYINETLKKI